MASRHDQQGSEQQRELEHQASSSAEAADEPAHLREQRVAALQHRLMQRKVADTEQKNAQYYHAVTNGETFVGCQWRFVDPRTSFVAHRPVRRTTNVDERRSSASCCSYGYSFSCAAAFSSPEAAAQPKSLRGG